ncbi:MAG: 4-hydroxythreonine-4-phosphate dehydrogenase PdxA [bacterium]|nr:4-hydroxythreonine-4-phosphate dehydrogenase PdxA [bacterium]
MANKRPVLALTMGDAAGVGPEIIALALEEKPVGRSVVVVGDIERLRAGAEKARSSTRYKVVESIEKADEIRDHVPVLNVPLGDETIPFGRLSAVSGECAYQCLVKAIDLSMEGKIDAIVTAPINKEAIHLAGHDFPGHTEVLAYRTGAQDTVMMLVAGPMRALHVTTHIPVAMVPSRVTIERIVRVLELGDAALKKMGLKTPSFAVAGLNPHAGESGIFGAEEKEIIIPAIRTAREMGIRVEGPIPPDVVFLKMHRGKYDAVIAMYHDQGHIPLKLLAFESGVNVTLGLPIIRTSVDHGTAFDIAGKGLADPGSLTEALRLASSMAGTRTR